MRLAPKVPVGKVVRGARAVAGNGLGAGAAQAEVEAEERSLVAVVLSAAVQVAGPAVEANSVAEAADAFFASK
jgi:hypothetical protein